MMNDITYNILDENKEIIFKNKSYEECIKLCINNPEYKLTIFYNLFIPTHLQEFNIRDLIISEQTNNNIYLIELLLQNLNILNKFKDNLQLLKLTSIFYIYDITIYNITNHILEVILDNLFDSNKLIKEITNIFNSEFNSNKYIYTMH